MRGFKTSRNKATGGLSRLICISKLYLKLEMRKPSFYYIYKGKSYIRLRLVNII
nr:MAG TPA: hypothetical protein [Caudoviricetes sp.]